MPNWLIERNTHSSLSLSGSALVLSLIKLEHICIFTQISISAVQFARQMMLEAPLFGEFPVASVDGAIIWLLSGVCAHVVHHRYHFLELLFAVRALNWASMRTNVSEQRFGFAERL